MFTIVRIFPAGVRVVGITGGIGTGKTTLARLVASFGAYHLDADVVARRVMEPGTEGHERVVEAFGGSVLAPDGTIDRKRLGSIVFSDPLARKTLESLVHPLITREVERQLAGHPGRVVYEAALLLEAGHDRYVDAVVAVTAPVHERIQRVMARSGQSRQGAEAVIRSQKNDLWYASRADAVVYNGDTIGMLLRDAHRLAGALGWL